MSMNVDCGGLAESAAFGGSIAENAERPTSPERTVRPVEFTIEPFTRASPLRVTGERRKGVEPCRPTI